ncbi:MAG TPA: NAD(P)H-hydrate dehydratase, partial [Chloroflexi bacterium]|nr:NAD(P)H-hydrate dehydratase [Chloroflexota bacterium]
VLMQNAAAAARKVMFEQITSLPTSHVLVICGPGNNGEDGLVLARQLAVDKIAVEVLLLPDSLSGSARQKCKTLRKMGIKVHEWNEAFDLAACVQSHDIIVDAIFGIGLTRPARGQYEQAIRAINQSDALIVSLDIPSGITSDTGETLGEAVYCDICVILGILKAGNLINYGYAHIKSCFLSSLSAPYQQYTTEQASVDVFINSPVLLPERAKTGHKTTFGQCLTIAGSSNYYGAPYFSCSSFLKTGGGYVRLITPQSVAKSVASLLPECVFLPVDDHDNLQQYLGQIDTQCPNQDFIIFGPGISLAKQNLQILEHLLTAQKWRQVPLLIDGDGLSILAINHQLLSVRLPYTTILTPHPGEMSRLTGLSIDQIEADLINIARRYAAQWKVILVLKGPRTIIATENAAFVNTSGTDALATPGSGDILDGMIAALACTGIELVEAVRAAVFMHGLIGNHLSAHDTPSGFTASDILSAIPAAAGLYKQKCQEYISHNSADSIPGITLV